MEIDKAALRKRTKEIDAQITKLIDLYQLGSIPMETITSRVNALSAERASLQEKIDAPDDVPAADLFLEAVSAYQNGFQSGNTDQRRLLLSSLIERVEIDGQSAKICWRL